MAGLIGKITAYARTPAGQRMIRSAAQRAQAMAKDPKTRAKVGELRQRAADRQPRRDPGAGPTQP
jgi:hypothetical protein